MVRPLPHDRPEGKDGDIELLEELAGKIKVGKVDVDANNGLAATYGVRTIPTLLVIKDGEIMDTMVGASSKDAIMQRLRPFM